MLDHLLARISSAHRRPAETEQAFRSRLRQADIQLAAVYRSDDVSAGHAYAQPILRAAYLLRYLPHYVLQLGDILRCLEGEPAVAAAIARPELRHAALCGGPAPETIALAVLHQQAGGRWLHTTVLDQLAHSWSDCWPISAEVAMAFSHHPAVVVDGCSTDLAHAPSSSEVASLGSSQVLTLMNGFNELMKLGQGPLSRALQARLEALPPGALVLASDQASYVRSEQGLALLLQLLQAQGARILLERTTAATAHEVENRFDRPDGLQAIYGQSAGPDGPITNYYRIRNRQLQLAAVLP